MFHYRYAIIQRMKQEGSRECGSAIILSMRFSPISGYCFFLWETRSKTKIISSQNWRTPYQYPNSSSDKDLVKKLTKCGYETQFMIFTSLNPLNAELNPICYLLALLGAHHFLHVSRIRVNIALRVGRSLQNPDRYCGPFSLSYPKADRVAEA